MVEKLVKGNEVTVIDDLSNGTLANLRSVRKEIKFTRGDISRESSARRVGKVEGIFHLACHPRSFSFDKPARDVDVNMRSTANMLELARKHNAKVVFTSNSGIYGEPQYLPMDESHPIDCKTPYDVNKYASELLIRTYHRQYGLPTVVCRLATVYGPRQRVNEKLSWRPVVATFLERLTKRKSPTIFGDGEQTRDLIYVEDVADGLVKAFNSEETSGEVFNLSTGVETSVNSLLRTITELLGSNIEPEHGSSSVGDVRRMCCSNLKAEKAFGFCIGHPLQVALKEYIKTTTGST